jgi:hypothetical protein
MKDIKGILALSIMLCILLTSVQSAIADGTVTVSDPTNDLLRGGNPQNPPAPPQFYVSFADVVESHISLSSGTYTFEMTLASTPSDWLTTSWEPKLAPPLDVITINLVAYRFRPFDSSGNALGRLGVTWRGGNIVVNIAKCPADEPGLACEQVGLGSETYKPDSLTFSYDQASNSVTLTLSQADFEALFPTATQWRSTAQFNYVNGGLIVDRAPDSDLLSLPTP